MDGWKSVCALACYLQEAYLSQPSCSGNMCNCGTQVRKVESTPCYNGQECVRENGFLGTWGCTDTKWGKWDASDNKCVVCDGKKESGYFNCNGDYSGDGACESACGADSQCDELGPISFIDICTSSYLEVNRECDFRVLDKTFLTNETN